MPFPRRLLTPHALPRTIFAVWLLVGCAALFPKGSISEERVTRLQKDLARQEAQLRQEAEALREIADRREREAARMVERSSVEQRVIERQQQLAAQLREAAREAESRAAELAQKAAATTP